ncbi:MAG: hypothetical protein ACTSXH_13870 [Promethearchaeota archaeon]
MEQQKCKLCGKSFKKEELECYSKQIYLCNACKEYYYLVESIERLEIKFLEDDMPAIVVPSNIFVIKRIRI